MVVVVVLSWRQRDTPEDEDGRPAPKSLRTLKPHALPGLLEMRDVHHLPFETWTMQTGQKRSVVRPRGKDPNSISEPES